MTITQSTPCAVHCERSESSGIPLTDLEQAHTPASSSRAQRGDPCPSNTTMDCHATLAVTVNLGGLWPVHEKRGAAIHDGATTTLDGHPGLAPTVHLGAMHLVQGEADLSRIVEMAWEDRTSFEAIEAQFGLNESAVIALMRRHMKPSSFRMWRKRVTGRRTKHAALRDAKVLRHRATHTRQ